MLPILRRFIAEAPVIDAPRLTLASRVFDTIGTLAFGPPKSRNLPSSFFYIQTDRLYGRAQADRLSDTKTMKVSLAVDYLRRQLLGIAAKAGFIAAALVCTGLISLAAVVRAAGSALA